MIIFNWRYTEADVVDCRQSHVLQATLIIVASAVRFSFIPIMQQDSYSDKCDLDRF